MLIGQKGFCGDGDVGGGQLRLGLGVLIVKQRVKPGLLELLDLASRNYGLDVVPGNEGYELGEARHFDRAGDEGETESSEENAGGCSAHGALVEKDAMYAKNELGAAMPCTERQGISAAFEAAFGKAGETGSVRAGSVGDADDALIASHFALAAQTMLKPCQSRIEREDDEAELLEEVGPVVAAAEMFGFVEDDLPELGRREARKQPVRNEDARREKANDAGSIKGLDRADFDAGNAAMSEAVDFNRLGSLPQLPQPEGVHDECAGTNE